MSASETPQLAHAHATGTTRYARVGMVSASDVMAWCGFFGAWLLVAGPMFQGALELREEELDRQALHEAAKSVPAPERLSMWWWLVPPVLYLLKRRHAVRRREMTLAALTPEKRKKAVMFVSKATGWFMVAAGGTLLASKETWQLVERYAVPAWLFWVGVAVMLMLCTLNTAVRMVRAERTLDRDVKSPADRPPHLYDAPHPP
jgi:hypothetical protein